MFLGQCIIRFLFLSPLVLLPRSTPTSLLISPPSTPILPIIPPTIPPFRAPHCVSSALASNDTNTVTAPHTTQHPSPSPSPKSINANHSAYITVPVARPHTDSHIHIHIHTHSNSNSSAKTPANQPREVERWRVEDIHQTSNCIIHHTQYTIHYVTLVCLHTYYICSLCYTPFWLDLLVFFFLSSVCSPCVTESCFDAGRWMLDARSLVLSYAVHLYSVLCAWIGLRCN